MIDCQAVRSIFNSAAWEIKVAVTLELCGAKVIDCTLGFFRIIHTRQNDTQQSLRLSLSLALFNITKSCCKQTCIKYYRHIIHYVQKYSYPYHFIMIRSSAESHILEKEENIISKKLSKVQNDSYSALFDSILGIFSSPVCFLAS